MSLKSIAIRGASVVATLVTVATLAACSGSEGGTTSGTSSTTNGTTGTSGSVPSSGCAGDIANCAVGTLSTAQLNDMCSILSTAIDDPPGTKFECKKGDESRFISVNSKEDCIAKPPPKTCKATVTQLVGCFKNAKKDACAALGSGGACTVLFDPATGCAG